METEVGEDAFEQMQKRLAKLGNLYMILSPTPEDLEKTKQDVIASMKRTEEMQAMRKRDKRTGEPDLRANKIERRHGDRRRGSRSDEGS